MSRQGKRANRPVWHAQAVRALRQHLGATQQEMAELLGARQQTISEWEKGLYRPRGISQSMLTIIAERADFRYQARQEETPGPGKDTPQG